MDVCRFFQFKTISSESIVEDSVLVEAAFVGTISPSEIPEVEIPSFVTDLDFALFILAGSEVCLKILFGAMVGKISFVRFFASDGILFPSVRLALDALLALGEGAATTFEEEFVLGAAFLEAFVGAGGRGLIFNIESGSTPAPIGLQ